MLGVIVAAITFVASLLVYATCTFQVEEYERAVVTRWGVISDVVGPGLRWRNPLVENVTEFRVDNQRVRNDKHPANVYTVDNQEVNVIYQVIYQLPGSIEGLTFIYKNALNYESQLDGLIVDRLKRELGTVNNNSLARERNNVTNVIEKRLQHDLLETYQIKLVSFQMVDITYPDSFRKANEQAAQAKAKIETEANILLQEQKIAEQKVARAEGDGKAKERQAAADAFAEREVGRARADAAEALGKALAANQALVEYEKAKRWSGNLPHMMGIGAVPFMNVDQKALDSAFKTR